MKQLLMAKLSQELLYQTRKTISSSAHLMKRQKITLFVFIENKNFFLESVPVSLRIYSISKFLETTFSCKGDK